MAKFIIPFSIIIVALFGGYLFDSIRKRGEAGTRWHMSDDAAERMRLGMQRFAMLIINPVAFCGAIWTLDLSETRYFLLPIIGIAALAAGLGLGFAGARLLQLKPDQAGPYVTCASFTNIGNIGGLVVFMLLGESGFALIPFYKLIEELWYYAVLFPLARSFGERAASGSPGGSSLAGARQNPLRFLRDPFMIMALLAVTLGLGLNIAGIRRPAFYAGLNAIIVPASSFLLLFAIGMRLRFRLERGHRPAALLLTAGKAVVVPIFATVLATILGLGNTAGSLGLKVVLVLSAMPVGFLGLVPPSLYRLDQDFAGSLWLTSNGALAVIVPALALILSL